MWFEKKNARDDGSAGAGSWLSYVNRPRPGIWIVTSTVYSLRRQMLSHLIFYVNLDYLFYLKN
jgi:hypothetical protein